MQLNQENLHTLTKDPALEIPGEHLFNLPERVLQFGTGVLLRGLPDFFIDKANKQGIFNGRVVIVKSTDSDSTTFDRQNGLYTVCVRGIEQGETVEENIINASVSRVLSAKSDWKTILGLAHNPELKIIISNTTEVGIQLVDDDISLYPPVSFPGKLLAFLVERYTYFEGAATGGLVIVPTELITDNGSELKKIVLQLADQNKVDAKIIEWIDKHNRFCNSLVDRIVPGKPAAHELKKLESTLGYSDELLTMSEVFRLWAIEGDELVKNTLSFGQADSGMVITPDITLFKELKLRLLNGTHTFNCGLAFLAGFSITREAVKDPVFGSFAKKLMEEIATAIPFPIDGKQKAAFADSVFERFCNPFIDHQWQSITMQVTSKMKMRNLPLLLQHYTITELPPRYMVAGFAGYLLYMRVTRKEGNRYFGERKGIEYEIKDDAAGYFFDTWQNNQDDQVVKKVLSNTTLWSTDLSQLTGFTEAVAEQMSEFNTSGILESLSYLETKKLAAK